MKLINKTENKNDLFSRNEIILEVENEVVPSFDQAKELIVKEFKTNESLIRIRKIDSQFGSNIFKIIADIYDSQEEFNRVVKKTKQEIDAEKKAEEEKIAAEKAAAEEKKKAEEEAKVAAEAPKEETPVEETKEEVKEEKTEEKTEEKKDE
jgi:ribosomal protein S24E